MGQTPEVREGDREVGFTPQERTFLRTAASRQKRSFVIFGFGKYGDARIFSAGMGFPDTKWIEQIFEVGGD
jgi:hypothetical protein